MDKDNITSLDASPHNQGAVTGRSGDEETGSLLERPSLGDGEERDLCDAELVGEGTLAGTEDTGSDGEARGVLCVLWGGEDDACEFGTSDPGEGYLFVLVSSLILSTM